MMAAEEGVSAMDVQTVSENNAFSGSALLIVIGEPCSEDHKELIVEKLTKGLQSWDTLSCGIDINEALEQIAEAAPSGSEGPNGERIIQNYSENLHVDILINPEIQTFLSQLRILLKKNLTYRHIVFAGHVFGGSGSWVLQDDRVPFNRFVSIFNEEEISEAIKQQADKILAISAFNEGDWNPSNFAKQKFGKLLEVRLNPGTKLESITGVVQFSAFMSYFINPVTVKDLLKSSDVVGNIRFSRPTLYIFPGSQGDSALFGISGFNLLLNGGYSRRSCFWDFTRHLDRIDALLLSHLGEDNLFGASSVLQRKAQENVHPELGFVYFNGLDDKQKNTQNGDCHPEEPPIPKAPSLIVDLVQEGNSMIENMKCISQAPHPCLGKNLGTQLQPINLYHKVGHGSLDMYVLNPLQDNKDLKEFFAQWNKQSGTFASKNGIPLPHLLSIAALLVWKPSSPSENITRILFPGSCPQAKLFDGLDKLKTVDMFKHPECSEESLKAPPATKVKKGSVVGGNKAAPVPKSTTPTSSSRTPRKDREAALAAEAKPESIRSPRSRPIPAKPNGSPTKPASAASKAGAKKIDKKTATKSGTDSDTKSSSSVETPPAPANEVQSPAESTATHDSVLAVSEASTAEVMETNVDILPKSEETNIIKPVSNEVEITKMDTSAPTEEDQPPMLEPSQELQPQPEVVSPLVDSKVTDDASSSSPVGNMPEVDQLMRDESPSESLEAPEAEQKQMTELLIEEPTINTNSEISEVQKNDDMLLQEESNIQSEIAANESSDDTQEMPILQEQNLQEQNLVSLGDDNIHVTESPDSLPDPAEFDPDGFRNIDSDPEPPVKTHQVSLLDDEKDIDTSVQEKESAGLPSDIDTQVSNGDTGFDQFADHAAISPAEEYKPQNACPDTERQLSSGSDMMEKNEALESVVSPVIEPSLHQEPLPLDENEQNFNQNEESHFDLVMADSKNEESNEVSPVIEPSLHQEHLPLDENEQNLNQNEESNFDSVMADSKNEESNEVSPVIEPSLHQEPLPLDENEQNFNQNEESNFDSVMADSKNEERNKVSPVIEPSLHQEPLPLDENEQNLNQNEESNFDSVMGESNNEGSYEVDHAKQVSAYDNVADIDLLGGFGNKQETDALDEQNNAPVDDEYSRELQHQNEPVLESQPHEEGPFDGAQPEALPYPREPDLCMDEPCDTSIEPELLETKDNAFNEIEKESHLSHVEEPQKCNDETEQLFSVDEDSKEAFAIKEQSRSVLEQDSLNISSDSLLDTRQEQLDQLSKPQDFENITDSPKEEYPAPECDLYSTTNPFLGMSSNEPIESGTDSIPDDHSSIPFASETPPEISSIPDTNIANDYQQDLMGNFEHMEREIDEKQRIVDGAHAPFSDEEDDLLLNKEYPLNEDYDVNPTLKDNIGFGDGLEEQTDFSKLPVEQNTLEQVEHTDFHNSQMPKDDDFDGLQEQSYFSKLPVEQNTVEQVKHTDFHNSEMPKDEDFDPFNNSSSHAMSAMHKETNKEQQDEFDPLKEWGEPMGLPSPAPTSDKNDSKSKSTTATRKMAGSKATTKDASTRSGSRVGSAPAKGAAAGKDDQKKPTSSASRLGATRKPASAPSSRITAAKENGSKPESTGTTRRPPAKSAEDAKKPTTGTVTSKRTSMGIKRAGASTPTSQKEELQKTDSKPAPRSTRTARPGVAASSAKSSEPAPVKLIPVIPFYVGLTYIPHHGDSNYMNINFFRRVRARYYVYSALQPDPNVLESLLAAKQTWDDPTLETTVIPTYDTDALRQWMAQNREKLAGLKVDVAPSASRCTIQLQDHETSCAAYRLEF